MILNSFLDFDSQYFLQIGNFGITWYAVCILTGVILAAVLGVRESKKFGISSNLILDGVLICVPLAIIGARLYYVFTSWNSFYVKGELGKTLLNIIGYSETNGFQLAGLAINGGIFVAIIFVIIYCYKRKMNTLVIFDQLAPGLLIGQICGRWGNFFNQEAHGPAMSAEAQNILSHIIPKFIMDKMYFYNYDLAQKALWHPTFLYESLWNLVGLTIILVSRAKNKIHRIGDGICFYLIWYGLGRACIIEPLRMDPLLFIDSVGPDVLFNRVNVVINLLLAIAGITWLTLKHTKIKEPFYIEAKKKYQEEKIDGVVTRIEDVLVGTDRLVKNAYYYTAKKYLEKELYDDELDKIKNIDYRKYFNYNEEAIKFFEDYFKENINQLSRLDSVKLFYQKLFKHDYHVAVYTKYDKEFAEYVLELLGITRFVSIIVDEEISDSNPLQKALDSISSAKHILVISNTKEDIKLAKEHEIESCSFASDLDSTYNLRKFIELDNIIIE